MARQTITYPDELEEQIDGERDVNMSRSEWIRQAIRLKLELNNADEI